MNVCLCLVCESLCLCHDEWIPCVVRLKPKLHGPVVDSCVSPTHCPRGSQSGPRPLLRVCLFTHMKHGLGLHRAQIWLIPRRGWRTVLCCFAQMHAHTQTHIARNDSYITGSERGPCGSTHLPKTDVKNKSERSSQWRETPHCCNSTNSLHSTLTGEQTAAHDNTHQWWK